MGIVKDMAKSAAIAAAAGFGMLAGQELFNKRQDRKNAITSRLPFKIVRTKAPTKDRPQAFYSNRR